MWTIYSPLFFREIVDICRLFSSTGRHLGLLMRGKLGRVQMDTGRGGKVLNSVGRGAETGVKSSSEFPGKRRR